MKRNRQVQGSKSAKRVRRTVRAVNGGVATQWVVPSPMAQPQRRMIKRNVTNCVPEMNSVYYGINVHRDSSSQHSPLEVTETSGPLITTQTYWPRIHIGNTFGTKIGNKCIIRRIGLKLLITATYDTFNELVHLWLVKKIQSNKTPCSVDEIWAAGTAPVNATDEWRNPDFIKNYKIMKHWKIVMNSNGQDDGTYPGVGTINGWIPPRPVYIEKNYNVEELFDNTGVSGDIATNTGVTYSLFMGVRGLSDGYILGSPDVFIRGSIKVSFTEN